MEYEVLLSILFSIAYVLLLVYTIIRILLETYSTPKTLAYIMLVFWVPLLGLIFFYSFGVNFRHKKRKRIGLEAFKEIDVAYQNDLNDTTASLIETYSQQLEQFKPLVHFANSLDGEHLSMNAVKLLVNGEEKFPIVIEALRQAEKFIHLEYYAWENDVRGNQIKDVLIERSKAGVKVRALYDAYASRGISNNIVKQLRESGIDIYPIIRIKLAKLANRLNHRDHRKVINIDGRTCFVGGINLSDRYDNSIDTGLYWRDTHAKFEGPLCDAFQRHFIASWNSTEAEKISFAPELFPNRKEFKEGIPSLCQIVSGGPVYHLSTILLSYLRVFTLAKERLWITNPYFIPSESVIDALRQAAISGVDVRLLLPEQSDSLIVGAASRFYFGRLLDAGVKIYLYTKGFVHAKTVVADGKMSIIGTANMDIRSFELNFEIMALIYSETFGAQMEEMFTNDLKDAILLDADRWGNMPIYMKLWHSVARLASAFL